MGSLKGLRDEDKNTHLLLTYSNIAEMYVYDVLKERCEATVESVCTINNNKSFKLMSELVNMQPNLSDKWFFIIEYSKVKGLLQKSKGIFESTSSVFLIKVNSYGEFKEVKDLGINLNDLYLVNIKKVEVMDLLRNFKISPALKDFIASSYYKDPDKVFVLVKELENGAVINSSKDIIKICGESTGSIQKFVVQLLVDSPKTERFLQRSYKKRVATLCNLCDSFGSSTTYNYIRSAIKDILYIKMLYLQGVIYDRIAYLPECFDEKKLARYSFYLRVISQDVAYNKIVYLYNVIGEYGKWVTAQDGILFLYKYYIELLNKKTLKG